MTHTAELGLARYDSMVRAIEVCERVDEAKDIRDQARAFQVYAAQAMNVEAEHRATKVRIRAERKVGELLKETKKRGERAAAADNLKRGPKSGDAISGNALSDLGISPDQSSQWQKLAEIPDEQFEKLVTSRDVKPSTEGVLESVKPVLHIPPVKYDRDSPDAGGRLAGAGGGVEPSEVVGIGPTA